MDKLFRIADFCFRVISDLPYAAPDHFQQFAIETGKQEYTYHIQEAQALPGLEGKRIARRPDMEVIREGTKESRLIGIKGTPGYYACYQEVSACEANIWVTGQMRGLMPSDTVYTSLFALERRMIGYGGLILHCAYIKYRGKGILFSGPSGIGKSTQAALWEQYRNSAVINGDRALLRRENGRWLACGWPVCGSSGICHREDVPIHAIVMLRQDDSNSTIRLSPAEAFGQLYPQITVNQWNPAFVQMALDGINNLIQQVPVWRLDCNMTEDAVQCLESALFPDGTN